MNEIPLKVEIKRIDEVAIILLAANFYTSNTMAQNLKAALQEIFKDNQYYIIANMNPLIVKVLGLFHTDIKPV